MDIEDIPYDEETFELRSVTKKGKCIIKKGDPRLWHE